ARRVTEAHHRRDLGGRGGTRDAQRRLSVTVPPVALPRGGVGGRHPAAPAKKTRELPRQTSRNRRIRHRLVTQHLRQELFGAITRRRLKERLGRGFLDDLAGV